jgi:enolase
LSKRKIARVRALIEKEPLTSIKDLKEDDWRGIIALIVLIGGFFIIALSILLSRYELVAAVTPLMALTAQWYFKAKEQKE